MIQINKFPEHVIFHHDKLVQFSAKTHTAHVFDMIRWVALAAADAPTRYPLACIHVADDGESVIATDGRALHIVEADFGHGLADGNWAITKLTKTQVHVVPAYGFNYPNYKQVIPFDPPSQREFETPSAYGREALCAVETGLMLDSVSLRKTLCQSVERASSWAFREKFTILWDPKSPRAPVVFKLSDARKAVIMPFPGNVG